ncbi:type IV pilus modification PilV family protein [Thermanaerovibrio acidaminovorans]|uniref:type IV pilus modification PilV family protein n=1 Tax=Thermanaerovibrio acidaminovorans TaxID=81462 RepID=UPI003A523612
MTRHWRSISLGPRRGFSLAEILMAVLIGAVALMGTVAMFWLYASHYERVDQSARARMRAEEAVVLLQDWILNASVGVSADRPSDAFPGVSSLSSWGGMVEVLDQGRRLRFIYGVPVGSCLVAADSVTVPTGKETVLTLSSPLPSDIFDTSSTMKGWLAFPSGSSPLKIKEMNGTSVKVENRVSQDVVLVPMDEVFALRAADVQFRNGTIYVEDVTLTPSEPRTEQGAYADVRFSLSPKGDILTMHVLSRGGKPGKGMPQGWPSSFGTTLSSEDAGSHLVYARTSWRMRNR